MLPLTYESDILQNCRAPSVCSPVGEVIKLNLLYTPANVNILNANWALVPAKIFAFEFHYSLSHYLSYRGIVCGSLIFLRNGLSSSSLLHYDSLLYSTEWSNHFDVVVYHVIQTVKATTGVSPIYL